MIWQFPYRSNDPVFKIIGIAIGHETILIHPSDAFGEALNQWGAWPEFGKVSGELRSTEDLCVTEVLSYSPKRSGDMAIKVSCETCTISADTPNASATLQIHSSQVIGVG